jgi:hypothetical protein
MKVKHLYTAGDGFCANAVWPMWSEILAKILDCDWTNISQIGAGNEAIATQVLDALANTPDTQDSLWLVQWTQADRLDLQNSFRFKEQIAQDPVYHKNFFGPYWCSSASKIPFVDKHNRFISQPQHQSRGRLAQLAVAQALTQQDVEWRYLLTYPAGWREQEFIPESKWLLPSLQEFRKSSVYHQYDTGAIQPPSSVNLDWVEQHVLPWVEYDPVQFETIKQEMLSQDQKILAQHRL